MLRNSTTGAMLPYFLLIIELEDRRGYYEQAQSEHVSIASEAG